MPTFQFYKNKIKVAEFTGADPGQLQSLIEKHKTSDSGGAFSGSGYVLGGSGTGRTLSDSPPASTPDPRPAPSPVQQPPQSIGGGENDMFVSALVEMGFPKEQAQKAVAATGGVSVEAAMDW